MKVWVFAEERSGSTWLCDHIARALKLTFLYTDTPTDNCVHQTHNFDLLPVEGVILRTCRRDWYEQFLSYSFMCRYLWDQSWKLGEQHYPAITVTEDEVDKWVKTKRERSAKWNDRAQTIFYEDLYEGVQIPALNITAGFKQSNRGFQKLPYVKEDHFTNAEQIKEWLCQRYDK